MHCDVFPEKSQLSASGSEGVRGRPAPPEVQRCSAPPPPMPPLAPWQLRPPPPPPPPEDLLPDAWFSATEDECAPQAPRPKRKAGRPRSCSRCGRPGHGRALCRAVWCPGCKKLINSGHNSHRGNQNNLAVHVAACVECHISECQVCGGDHGTVTCQALFCECGKMVQSKQNSPSENDHNLQQHLIKLHHLRRYLCSGCNTQHFGTGSTKCLGCRAEDASAERGGCAAVHAAAGPEDWTIAEVHAESQSRALHVGNQIRNYVAQLVGSHPPLPEQGGVAGDAAPRRPTPPDTQPGGVAGDAAPRRPTPPGTQPGGIAGDAASSWRRADTPPGNEQASPSCGPKHESSSCGSELESSGCGPKGADAAGGEPPLDVIVARGKGGCFQGLPWDAVDGYGKGKGRGPPGDGAGKHGKGKGRGKGTGKWGSGAPRVPEDEWRERGPGRDPIEEIAEMAHTLDETLGYADFQLAWSDLTSRGQHLFRLGWRLDSLQEHLSDHSLRCESVRVGDVLMRLDGIGWRFSICSGQRWESASQAVNVLELVDPPAGRLKVMDTAGHFGTVDICSFMFDIQGAIFRDVDVSGED